MVRETPSCVSRARKEVLRIMKVAIFDEIVERLR
jgi:hypothetical protein